MASVATPLIEEKKAAVSKIELRALTICEKAKACKIDSQSTAEEAAAFLTDIINPLIREGDELFDPMIASAFQTHQMTIATKRKAVGGLPAAKLYIRGELARWEQLVQDRARVERLRLEQIARDEEAARIEREVEAVEVAAGPDVAQEVAAIIESPRPALTMQPPPTAPKLAGVSARDVYTAEVTNLREFYKAIGDGRTAVTLADPNQGALNRMAGAMKEGFNVAGCRLIKSKQVNSSRRS